MATVLIIGASQGVGRETVIRALEAGHTVRAFARSADEMDIFHDRLTKISASATDSDAVVEAVDGCDVVITTLGMGPTFRPVHLFSRSARVIINAMRDAGVDKLIALTGLGAGDSKGIGNLIATKFLQPFFLGTIYEDKDREETLIRQSGLDWVIVRPGVLTRLTPTSDYKVLVEPDTWRSGFISRGDVADFLVKQIDDDSLIGKTPVIVG